MSTYRWYLKAPGTHILTMSEERYSSVKKARESAERYAINKWSHLDPEDIILFIHKPDGACVYYNFVVPDANMEGLNVLERHRLAEMVIRIKPRGFLFDIQEDLETLTG